MTAQAATNPDSDFMRVLKQRVKAYFRETGKPTHDDGRLLLKSLILLGVFIGLYVLLLTVDRGPGPTLLIAVAWGLSTALVAFNVPHDATHGATSKSPRVNTLWSYVFNLVGMNRYTWWLKHDQAHHAYTNVCGWDPDIDAWPILRLSPERRPLAFHRFQHLYAPAAYLLLGLFFVAWIDFKLFFDRRLARHLGIRHAPRELLILLASKAFYFGYALVIPMLVLPLSPGEVVIGFVIMYAVVGLASALVLLPSHCMPHAEFALAPIGDKGAWVRHQLAVTLDFAPSSRLANWFLGGFNTNAFHHLFPHICHVHYQPMTAILAETAAQHGVPYRSMSLPGAIRAHFTFLRDMGRGMPQRESTLD